VVALPLAAAVVAVGFSASTWLASRTRGVALRVWSIALLQFAAASGALAWGIGFGWTPAAYRIFYLFGAVLNVAWLALGTVWLLGGTSAGRGATALLVAVSLYAAAMVVFRSFVSGADTALTAGDIPRAADVMPSDVRALSRWFSIGGSVVLLGGLLSSVVRRRNALGLGLLAAGVVVVGVGSELARTGRVAPFSVGLALGITLMYAGFLRAT
jgi:hypothetical protein